MWAFAFGRGPCLPRPTAITWSFCFLIRAHRRESAVKLLTFPMAPMLGVIRTPSPPPASQIGVGFRGCHPKASQIGVGFRRILWHRRSRRCDAALRIPYPPPPPIRILKHLCDFVPGCPRLARVCQPLWPFASCTCFRVVKDPSNTPLFRSGTNLQLYHLFALLSREKHAALALREFPSMPPPFG
jgi:hypothetical protein